MALQEARQYPGPTASLVTVTTEVTTVDAVVDRISSVPVLIVMTAEGLTRCATNRGITAMMTATVPGEAMAQGLIGRTNMTVTGTAVVIAVETEIETAGETAIEGTETDQICVIIVEIEAEIVVRLANIVLWSAVFKSVLENERLFIVVSMSCAVNRFSLL